MLFTRGEGTRIRQLPMLRVLMPHLMPTRTECVVYFEQQLDVENALAYCEARNVGAGEKRINLFTMFLAACVRAIGMRPKLNRFVVGRRLYQRHALSISFAVKKQFRDDGRLTTVKVDFHRDDTLEQVAERVREAVGVGKGEQDTGSEKEMRLVTRLPRFVLKALMGLQRWLDYWNLLPWAMLRGDPLYASLFVANLGSVGLDAAYHHLFEYGTCPLFATLGKIKKAPVVDQETGELSVRTVATVRYSYDERIADGFYASKTLDLFQRFVENPEELERPPEPPTFGDGAST